MWRIDAGTVLDRLRDLEKTLSERDRNAHLLAHGVDPSTVAGIIEAIPAWIAEEEQQNHLARSGDGENDTPGGRSLCP